MSVEAFVSSLELLGLRVVANASGWQAQCPAHQDDTPSLSITNRGGTPLVYCHAGCPTENVLESAGWKWSDLLDGSSNGTESGRSTRRVVARQQQDYGECVMPVPVDAKPVPEKLLRMNGELPSRRWKYRDAHGRMLHGVMRWDLESGKEIRPISYWRRHGIGGWRIALPPAPRPLYGLDRLAAQPSAPVLLVEGEKAADAAQVIFPDHACVCWSGGASAIGKMDWLPVSGRRVIAWPDADDAGRLAMSRLAEVITIERIVDTAALPEKWDLADFPPVGIDLRAMLADQPNSADSADFLIRRQIMDRLKEAPEFKAVRDAVRDSGLDLFRVVSCIIDDSALAKCLRDMNDPGVWFKRWLV